MEFIKHLYQRISYFAVHMDFSDYAVFLVGVLLVGFVCLRGFGSRTSW